MFKTRFAPANLAVCTWINRALAVHFLSNTSSKLARLFVNAAFICLAHTMHGALVVNIDAGFLWFFFADDDDDETKATHV